MATCPECGAAGEWIDREHQTFAGRMECLVRQADALGDSDEIRAQVSILKDWMSLARDRVLGVPTPGLDFDAPEA